LYDKVEVPICDNLSISAYRIWKIHSEIELNKCKYKDEEECKTKRFLFPRMNILFNINVNFSFGHSGLIDSPFTGSFGTFPCTRREERRVDKKVQTDNFFQ